VLILDRRDRSTPYIRGLRRNSLRILLGRHGMSMTHPTNPIVLSARLLTDSQAYMLPMVVLVPINGRVSDIIGRKPLLYFAIFIFTVSSALCGAAKNMQWYVSRSRIWDRAIGTDAEIRLIISRAFQGIGGGSIIGLA
jgi:MFS family permease